MRLIYIGILMALIFSVTAEAADRHPWRAIIVPHIEEVFDKIATKPNRTPTQAIQQMDRELDDYKTGANLSEADREHNRKIKERVLHSTFDLRYLSQLSLGKHWNDISLDDRDRFVTLLTNLLEEKAVLSKEQGKKKSSSSEVYTISYVGDSYLNPEKTKALTKTKVSVKSERVTIALNYKLRWKRGYWKVYDVIVDGASLVENYMYQFDSIITKHGFYDLIERMEKKLQEIRKDSDKSDKNDSGSIR